MHPIIFISISILLTIPSGLQAQSPYETDQTSKQTLKELQFLTGTWKGTGWVSGQDGGKHHFDQTENVQFKLDSTALLIEGRGTHEGVVTHDALAVAYFDPATSGLRLRSWLSSGRGGDFQAEMIDGALHWYIKDGMRYIIKVNEQGQWHEIGEMRTENGWYQFLEMTLDKEN